MRSTPTSTHRRSAVPTLIAAAAAVTLLTGCMVAGLLRGL